MISPAALEDAKKKIGLMQCWKTRCEGPPGCLMHHTQREVASKTAKGKRREQERRSSSASRITGKLNESFHVPIDASRGRGGTSKHMVGNCSRTSPSSERVRQLRPIYGSQGSYETTGLHNTGNLCYLNSVVQVLANSPLFSEQMLKIMFPPTTKTNNQNSLLISEELRFLITILQSGEFKRITPVTLKEKIDQKFDTYQGYRQHDAHELLMDIVNEVESEMATLAKYSSIETCNIFRGVEQSQLQCKVCLSPPRFKNDPFNCWHLDIPLSNEKSVDLESCLTEARLKEEILSVECKNCGKYQETAKKLIISVPPKMLIVHLKRFTEEQWAAKNDQFVTYPHVLDLPHSKAESCRYDLSAVIMHVGSHCNGGHYFCICYNEQTGAWCKYDDDKSVQIVKKDNVVHKDAYILFYKQREIVNSQWEDGKDITLITPDDDKEATVMNPKQNEMEAPTPPSMGVKDTSELTEFPQTPTALSSSIPLIPDSIEDTVDLVEDCLLNSEELMLEEATVNTELRRSKRSNKGTRKASDVNPSPTGEQNKCISKPARGPSFLSKSKRSTEESGDREEEEVVESGQSYEDTCGKCEEILSGFMVACDSCNEWYHGECVSVAKKNKDKDFICPKCIGEPAVLYKELADLKVKYQGLLNDIKSWSLSVLSKDKEIETMKDVHEKAKLDLENKIEKLHQKEEKQQKKLSEQEELLAKNKEEIESCKKELGKEKSSVEILTKKCSKLQKDVSTHQEVNKLLVSPSSSASNQGNKTEEDENKNETLNRSERKTMKNRISILEDIVREKENENIKLRTDLDAARNLVKREREINDVYTKWGLNPQHGPTKQQSPFSNGSTQEAQTNPTASIELSCETGGDAVSGLTSTEGTKFECTDEDEGAEIPLWYPEPAIVVTLSNNERKGQPEAIIKDDTTGLAKSVCSDPALQEEGELPKEKGQKDGKKRGAQPRRDEHSQPYHIDLTNQSNVLKDKEENISPKKKSKKWCFYELHEKHSCAYGKECRFSHDVPENGKDIMNSWFKNYTNLDDGDLIKLSSKLTENAEKSNSKIHSFLTNVIKEMVSKEIESRKERLMRRKERLDAVGGSLRFQA